MSRPTDLVQGTVDLLILKTVWLKSEWGESENNRRAKYYSLTKAGRKRLKEEVAQWRRLSTVIEVVVTTA